MRKNVLLLIFVSLFTGFAFAQTAITNGNLESWVNVGSNTEEPTQWNSNKTGGGNATSGPQTCFRDGNAHSGSYCAKVKTGLALGIVVVNGSLTTGKVEAPSTNKSDGYIRTVATDSNYRMSFTGRPDSIVFWYKYDAASSDYPRFEARLHVGFAYAPEAATSYHNDSSANIIARAAWTGANADISTWTRVSLPFTYVDGRTPQYILITTTSSAVQTGGSNGSTFWLDDIEAIYNPTIATGAVSAGPYYVSATTGTPVTVPFNLAGTYGGNNTVTAYLSDASGSFASAVNIGSVAATASGAISAFIPANTPTGTGYRIRVAASNPALTAADNGSDITINLVSTSIAPATAQTIAVNTNGTPIALTASNGATATEWQYATTSGGPYQPFVPAQTANTYTPSFSTPGTYYVINTTTYPGSLIVNSSEVQIDVVGNAVTPASPQSILAGTNGTTLTVTETPTGSSREWKYSANAGGPFSSFTPAETGTTYIPNFSSNGTYYVLCESVISGLTVQSNAVEISVNSVTLTTGTITGSPFQFSASAPDATVQVPYTTSGNFTAGNVFTAQLSDASGAFASPTNIGTVLAVSTGTISATIPANTPAGTGYRIRVVASTPSVSGNDNGTDLVVDQFNVSISPAAIQNIGLNTNGTQLISNPSQAVTSGEWLYSTTSGSGYGSFSPAQTQANYTPNFNAPGTYYIIYTGTNQYGDAVTSNEVQVNVLNGNTITTLAVSGSPFLVSASAHVTVTVDFTSDAVFSNGNTFNVELSDAAGSFAAPVIIGSANTSTPGPITATIPNSTPAGTGYRIRVTSTTPAITGSDNGSDLEVVPFEISLTPADEQSINVGESGTTVTANSTHTATYQWKYSDVSGIGYAPFSPPQTSASYTPRFLAAGTYYVICVVTNGISDVLTSQELVVNVADVSGINSVGANTIQTYRSANGIVVNLSTAQLTNPVLQLVNLMGQTVLTQRLIAGTVNNIPAALSDAVYIFRITDGNNNYTGKLKN